jgi:phosphate acetyltransferase
MRVRGPITKESSRKIETARRVFAEQVDQTDLLGAIDVSASEVPTPLILMCLADRVLAYGDCAVIPEPTTGQLADIAISSADTAQQFGIEPRVAMLSYSTGTSGSGAEVEKVRAATELVHQRAPELLLEGPIQYDAAIDPEVARTKLPNSPVAGRATVFIFPDLNTYKAVQRSAHAIAIGPVLRGPAEAGQ